MVATRSQLAAGEDSELDPTPQIDPEGQDEPVTPSPQGQVTPRQGQALPQGMQQYQNNIYWQNLWHAQYRSVSIQVCRTTCHARAALAVLGMRPRHTPSRCFRRTSKVARPA